MKPQPQPASTCGTIYILMHVPTGKFYIGSTIAAEKRKRQWSNNLQIGYVPERFLFQWTAFEWEFISLIQTDVSKLRQIERSLIDQAERVIPDMLLNTFTSTTTRNRRKRRRTYKFKSPWR